MPTLAQYRAESTCSTKPKIGDARETNFKFSERKFEVSRLNGVARKAVTARARLQSNYKLCFPPENTKRFEQGRFWDICSLWPPLATISTTFLQLRDSPF
jgi:hypothetical protein